MTNVTFCGVPVTTILSQSSTRIVAQTDAAPGPTNGDVVVYSSHYGALTRTNGFTYYAMHTLASVAGPHGAVTPASTNVEDAADVPFTITPAPWYHIGEVRTNETLVSSNWGAAPMVFVWSNVTVGGTLRISFAENLAPLGTPEWWLASYGITNGGLTFNQAETNNPDRDLHHNWQEYVADTDPTNPASYFRIDGISGIAGRAVSFLSSSNRAYTLEFRNSLQQGPWLPVPGPSNIWGNGGWLTLTNSEAAGTSGYYRIRVQLP